MLPPPSPKLALILHSLEDINETLRGHQPVGVEVETPPSGMANPEVSRDLDRCTSVEDLYYAKGQLDILNFILKLKQSSEDAYEELTA